MLELIDQTSVLIIVTGAVAYLVWFFWNTLRISSNKACGKPGRCKCGSNPGQ